MDWDKLKIFHTVAEASSFTKASTILNLSQSAISRQIQALESDLKVQLFERHARGLVLTENGEYLYKSAHEIISKLKDVEAVPTLFFEFHGSEQSNNENIKIVEEISKENNGSSFKWAKDLEDRNKLWKARWDVYYSVKALINNGRVYSTDVCLPISNITECVNYAEDQAKKFGLRAPMVGHLGDGNFHVLLPFDPNKKETYKK